MAVAVGQFIGGRHEVQAVLSPGGQGDVYRVLDHYENAVGVLKLLNPAVIQPGTVWLEAQILRHLADDHILEIRNADVVNGQPFIVTALATHGTLESELVAAGGLGVRVDNVVTWIRQACIGVARAHDANLIHNDIKPANLFLDANRNCLVGDFGLASMRLTPPLIGVARGATAETAAPEVASLWPTNTPPASVETDIYSLGATARWLLSGSPPVDLTGAAGVPARMAAAAAQTPPRLRDVAPHVPSPVAVIVEKAMSRHPGDRYHSVNCPMWSATAPQVPPLLKGCVPLP